MEWQGIDQREGFFPPPLFIRNKKENRDADLYGNKIRKADKLARKYLSNAKKSLDKKEAWIKAAKVFKAPNNRSIGLQLSYSEHEEENQSSSRPAYIASQNSLFANLIYQQDIGEDDLLKGGFSYTYDEVDGDPTNELQELSHSGDTIFISKGNYIVVPGISSLAQPKLINK